MARLQASTKLQQLQGALFSETKLNIPPKHCEQVILRYNFFTLPLPIEKYIIVIINAFV